MCIWAFPRILYTLRYEELWSKYNGLLKILEMRLSEIRKAHEENENLTEEIHLMKVKLHNYEDEIAILMKKMKEIRITKKIKVLIEFK